MPYFRDEFHSGWLLGIFGRESEMGFKKSTFAVGVVGFIEVEIEEKIIYVITITTMNKK